MIHTKQTTITCAATFSGIGLHTGKTLTVTMHPADADTGVVFYRTDTRTEIKAVPENLGEDLLRRTCIGVDGVSVNTIEHVMVVFSLLGIDNVRVDIDGDEVPGMDGSSKLFLDGLRAVGIRELGASRRVRTVCEPLYLDTPKASIVALPYDGFKLSYTLDYDAPEIGSSFYCFDSKAPSNLDELLSARTFCLKKEAEHLLVHGFGKGANTDNTCVITASGTPDKSAFRFPRELAAHKTLDIIGDLYLAGPIKGHIIAVRGGHAVNAAFVKTLIERCPRTA
jgi:UDP-3-O-acyl N-acetylglucosamine deacetylase